MFSVLENNSKILPILYFHIFSCMFTIGKTTYVDFLPFYNPEGGSELNILRVIIHFKRFELLTHPICEMFLHLKNLRARYFYWLANILNIVYTLMTILYVLLSYGNISGYFKHDCPDTTTEAEHQFDLDCEHKPHQDSCYKHILVLSLLDNAPDLYLVRYPKEKDSSQNYIQIINIFLFLKKKF